MPWQVKMFEINIKISKNDFTIVLGFSVLVLKAPCPACFHTWFKWSARHQALLKLDSKPSVEEGVMGQDKRPPGMGLKHNGSRFNSQNFTQLRSVWWQHLLTVNQSLLHIIKQLWLVVLMLTDLAAAQRMLPELLQMMLLLDEKLPTVLPAVREWRLSLFRAVAVLSNLSAAALEAVVLVSQCNEILLSIALVFTNSLALYISTMLRLNAFLRRTLAGVLSSREQLDQQGHPSCSTWPSSQSSRSSSCSVRWLKSVLRAVPALCHRTWSICMTLIHVALSDLFTLCNNFRSSVFWLHRLCLVTPHGYLESFWMYRHS